MHQFFLPEKSFENKTVQITGEDANHIIRVLRMKRGDVIILSDGCGRRYKAEIQDITKDRVSAVLLEKREKEVDPPIELIVVQGLPKKDKMEFIVQKLTELGMARLIPVNTTRTIVKLNSKKAQSRRERWQRIALEAAKQCKRAKVPIIEKPCLLREALDNLQADLIIFPWEDENSNSLREVLQTYSHDKIKKIAIVIGPEGGWEPEEVELAKEYGAKSVSLGPRILRTETATIAAAGIILYHFGDLGG